MLLQDFQYSKAIMSAFLSFFFFVLTNNIEVSIYNAGYFTRVFHSIPAEKRDDR